MLIGHLFTITYNFHLWPYATGWMAWIICLATSPEWTSFSSISKEYFDSNAYQQNSLTRTSSSDCIWKHLLNPSLNNHIMDCAGGKSTLLQQKRLVLLPVDLFLVLGKVLYIPLRSPTSNLSLEHTFVERFPCQVWLRVLFEMMQPPSEWDDVFWPFWPTDPTNYLMFGSRISFPLTKTVFRLPPPRFMLLNLSYSLSWWNNPLVAGTLSGYYKPNGGIGLFLDLKTLNLLIKCFT